MYALYGKLYLIIKIAFTDFLLLCCYIIYIVSVLFQGQKLVLGKSTSTQTSVMYKPNQSNKAMNNVVFIYA